MITGTDGHAHGLAHWPPHAGAADGQPDGRGRDARANGQSNRVAVGRAHRLALVAAVGQPDARPDRNPIVEPEHVPLARAQRLALVAAVGQPNTRPDRGPVVEPQRVAVRRPYVGAIGAPNRSALNGAVGQPQRHTVGGADRSANRGSERPPLCGAVLVALGGAHHGQSEQRANGGAHKSTERDAEHGPDYRAVDRAHPAPFRFPD